MRRIILTLFVVLALTAGGALLAQSTGTAGTTGSTSGSSSGDGTGTTGAPGNSGTTGLTGSAGSTGSSSGTAAATGAPDTTNSNPSNPPSSYGMAAGTGGELPRTASELPLFAALGLLALGAGFIVRSGPKA